MREWCYLEETLLFAGEKPYWRKVDTLPECDNANASGFLASLQQHFNESDWDQWDIHYAVVGAQIIQFGIVKISAGLARDWKKVYEFRVPEKEE